LRKTLIKTALDIISQEGIEKVTMRVLGQRIGISRSAPYRHFSNKSALLCAIGEEGFTELKKRLVHGVSSLFIDRQIHPKNAFLVAPALASQDSENAQFNVEQIFAYIGEILFTGILSSGNS